MCKGIKQMKVLIITVAGMSTRFSRSVGKPVIKCLYHNKSLKDSLLYILLERSREFDYFIIVGGYRYIKSYAKQSGHHLKSFQIGFF